MSQDFAVHGVKYDQQVSSQLEAQAAQHQSCKRHSWHLIAQSLHICQQQEQTANVQGMHSEVKLYRRRNIVY